MHNSIIAHCNLEKISFKVILYQKKKTSLVRITKFILSLKYENLESFSSASLTVFEDIGLSGFDNFAQPSMFTLAFCEQIFRFDLFLKYLFWMYVNSFTQSFTTIRKFGDCFICYLAAPQHTLGHCEGGSLINPMVITALTYFNLKVTRSLITRLGSKTKHLVFF